MVIIYLGSFYAVCFFIVAVGAVFAPALATIAAFQMVFFRENDVPFWGFVIVLRVQFFFEHAAFFGLSKVSLISFVSWTFPHFPF